jgi:bifunctional UDP-N-acetylglucosamine pyrophosphorylase/glucosamine-1-phosphate N-acetyltransferase
LSLEVAIVLAAGEGTRMKSGLAKVLHPIAGKSILSHVLDAIKPLTAIDLKVVVGAHRAAVETHLREIAPEAIAVFQSERNGTGHAVQIALEGVSEAGNVLILAGDTPLITSETLTEFLSVHLDSENDVSVLTALLPDPFGYGRILRDETGTLVSIVEERDATEEEKLIEEVNTGVYLFNLHALRSAIYKISSNNEQGELYLTDVISVIRSETGRAVAIVSNDYLEVLGINDRSQWAECAALMRDRINYQHLLAGVSIIDPTTTWIDLDVEIESDVVIFPGTSLHGKTRISSGSTIGPRSILTDVIVGSNSTVIESHCSSTVIGSHSNIGPFSYLRPGTVIGDEAKVGAFVEIKNSEIGNESKVPHLSYVGDATIGEGTNIGAATIFVNYDGVTKHASKIGDHVKIGSGTKLVAPVSVGDGAYTAAGSVITEDVPPGSIGVARGRQRNVLGWVLRKRSGTKSAAASLKAGAQQLDQSFQSEDQPLKKGESQ